MISYKYFQGRELFWITAHTILVIQAIPKASTDHTCPICWEETTWNGSRHRFLSTAVEGQCRVLLRKYYYHTVHLPQNLPSASLRTAKSGLKHKHLGRSIVSTEMRGMEEGWGQLKARNRWGGTDAARAVVGIWGMEVKGGDKGIKAHLFISIFSMYFGECPAILGSVYARA